MARPCIGEYGRFTTTPRASAELCVFAGSHRERVALTRDEVRALRRLYKFEPAPKSAAGQALLDQGNFMGLMREAETDGLRLVAYLARFCEPGQDPVKVLIDLIADRCDAIIDPEDVAWARNENSEDSTG